MDIAYRKARCASRCGERRIEDVAHAVAPERVAVEPEKRVRCRTRPGRDEICGQFLCSGGGGPAVEPLGMLGGGGLLGGEPERAQREQSCGYFSHKSDVSTHLALRQAGILEISFDSTLQTFFMVVFFCSVGFTACFRLLKKGGLQVLLFLGIAVMMCVLQNGLGAFIASAFGLDPRLGLATGSIPMVGGHGTAAFGPPPGRRSSRTSSTCSLTTPQRKSRWCIVFLLEARCTSSSINLKHVSRVPRQRLRWDRP